MTPPVETGQSEPRWLRVVGRWVAISLIAGLVTFASLLVSRDLAIPLLLASLWIWIGWPIVWCIRTLRSNAWPTRPRALLSVTLLGFVVAAYVALVALFIWAPAILDDSAGCHYRRIERFGEYEKSGFHTETSLFPPRAVCVFHDGVRFTDAGWP